MRYAHTCYRVLDLDRSLAFYCDALGFQLSRKVPIREEAINAFLTPPGSPDLPLELTYNIGREEPYEIGTGYGHIALYVDDLDATLAALDAKGVQPEKPPYQVRAGGSRLCFVRDPDGYRIELIEQGA
jgi:lactoylglutathione lyase